VFENVLVPHFYGRIIFYFMASNLLCPFIGHELLPFLFLLLGILLLNIHVQMFGDIVTNNVKLFFTCLLTVDLFGEMSIQILYSFLNRGVCLFVEL
jgi:hypothetical protein